MEIWIILNKLIVIFFCAIEYIKGSASNYTSVVFSLLIYISADMTFHIVNRKRYLGLIKLFNIVLLIGLTLYVNKLFILVLPMSLFELLEMLKIQSNLVWFIFLIIPLTVTETDMFSEYILISLLSYSVYFLASRGHRRIQNLNKEVDRLKEMNYLLNKNLTKDIEHENQIRYLSTLEERNKIAQEIHDNIGHTIAGSLMQLEAAKLIVDTDKEKSKDILDNVIIVLREGMEKIRLTLRNIKPPSEQLGINRIRLLVNDFKIRSNMEAVLVYKGELEIISYGQWKIIHENISEALTNTLKYSKATSVSINIEKLNKFIKIEIRDNGIGTFKITKGIGIRGIEERTENIGGKVIIDTTKGFSLIMLLPTDK